MTAAQLRAARALLRWSAGQLAKVSGVSLVTIRRSEVEEGTVKMMRANAQAIRASLEAAGVEFIPENGGGAGVRLRKGGAPHATPADHSEPRAVGPEDEDRVGPEAPEDADQL